MNSQANDDELTKARRALIDAEIERDTFKELVETVEGQRGHVESLLLRLLAESQEFLMPKQSPAYVAARRFMCEVATLDKYERRLS